MALSIFVSLEKIQALFCRAIEPREWRLVAMILRLPLAMSCASGTLLNTRCQSLVANAGAMEIQLLHEQVSRDQTRFRTGIHFASI
jgi:hypothetical protein